MEKILKNVNPVTLSTHVDEHGTVRASYEGTVLEPNDTLVVGLASRPEDGPLEVIMRILQPVDGSVIRVCHEHDNQPFYWAPIKDPPGYAHTWSETGHEYLVGVPGNPEGDGPTPVEPVIHIKVKPIEDLPDPSALKKDERVEVAPTEDLSHRV